MVKRTKNSGQGLRRSAADWEGAALARIASHGLRALSIPQLARSLGVTKGSFYWHFHGIQELIDAAMQRWEEMDRAMLEELRQLRDPRERLTALFIQAMERREAHALYIALSSMPEVAANIRRMNERRLQFLVEAYEQLGLSRRESREQSLLAYAAYVGALQLRQQSLRGLSVEKNLRDYVAHAVRTLIPPAQRKRRSTTDQR